MKKLILKSALLLVATNGWAGWLYIDSIVMGPDFRDYKGRKAQGTKMKVYIEDTMLTKHETGVYEPYLLSDLSYKKRKRSYSTISEFDLHCNEDILQVVKTTVYSKPMGKGEVLEELNDPFQGWWVFGSRKGYRHGFYSHVGEEMCKLLLSIDQNIPVRKGDHDH